MTPTNQEHVQVLLTQLRLAGYTSHTFNKWSEDVGYILELCDNDRELAKQVFGEMCKDVRFGWCRGSALFWGTDGE